MQPQRTAHPPHPPYSARPRQPRHARGVTLAAFAILGAAVFAAGHGLTGVVAPASGPSVARADDAGNAPSSRNLQAIAAMLGILLEGGFHDEARETLAALSERVRSGEVRGERLEMVRSHVEPVLDPIIDGDRDDPMFFDAAATAATWGHAAAVSMMRELARDDAAADTHRVAAIEALVTRGPDEVLDLAETLLAGEDVPQPVKRGVIHAISRLDSDRAGEAIVAGWPTFTQGARVAAIETLTQRTAWSVTLMDAIADERIHRDVLNRNQVRSLYLGADEQLAERIEQAFGQVRAERDPARQAVIEQVYEQAQRTPGDPEAGQLVFAQACAQCHTIYGEGTALGPDITENGRGSFEQLLSNILDPNLIINTGYQLQIVTMEDGRVIAGMMTEQDDQRLVIEMIGGQREVLAADQVASVDTSPISFMPEGLEQAMSDQEMIDLLAFLSLTAPPDDPDATLIPGAPAVAGIDPDAIHLPESVDNHLVGASYSSNIADWSDQTRGEIGDMVWDPAAGAFIRESPWHEYGVGFQQDLGVISEDDAVFWQAEWDQPVQANLIVLSGSYPNQPQEETAWSIDVRVDGVWRVHEQGTGGWLDRERYVWGGPGMPQIAFDGIRIRVWSPDDQTPVVSITFRGEPDVSWVVANVPEDVSIER